MDATQIRRIWQMANCQYNTYFNLSQTLMWYMTPEYWRAVVDEYLDAETLDEETNIFDRAYLNGVPVKQARSGDYHALLAGMGRGTGGQMKAMAICLSKAGLITLVPFSVDGNGDG